MSDWERVGLRDGCYCGRVRLRVFEGGALLRRLAVGSCAAEQPCFDVQAETSGYRVVSGYGIQSVEESDCGGVDSGCEESYCERVGLRKYWAAKMPGCNRVRRCRAAVSGCGVGLWG